MIQIEHCGYDLPLQPGLRTIGANLTSDHAYHHKNSAYNFVIYLSLWDRAFGTYHEFI